MAKNDWSDPEWGTDGELSKPSARAISNTKYGLASGMDTMGMLKAMAEDYYTPRRPDDAVSGIRPAIVIHAEIMQLGDVPDPVLKDMIDLLGDAAATSDVLVVYAAPAGGTSSMLPAPKNENDFAAKFRYPRFYSFAKGGDAATTILAQIGKPCNVEITDKVMNAFGVYHGMSKQELPSLSAGGTLYRAAGEGLVVGSFYDPKQRIDRVANLAEEPSPFFGGSLLGMELPDLRSNVPIPKPRDIEKVYGTLPYRPHPRANEKKYRGRIIIDKAWTKANIKRYKIPYLNKSTPMHVLVGEEFQRIFKAAVEATGNKYIPQRVWSQVPRRKLWRNDKDPSLHSWGITVDIDSNLNKYNTHVGPMYDYPEFVAVFEASGWNWGGRWTTPDPMHFERVDRGPPKRGPGFPGTRGG